MELPSDTPLNGASHSLLGCFCEAALEQLSEEPSLNGALQHSSGVLTKHHGALHNTSRGAFYKGTLEEPQEASCRGWQMTFRGAYQGSTLHIELHEYSSMMLYTYKHTYISKRKPQGASRSFQKFGNFLFTNTLMSSKPEHELRTLNCWLDSYRYLDTFIRLTTREFAIFAELFDD